MILYDFLYIQISSSLFYHSFSMSVELTSNPIKHYHWGSTAHDSLVRTLANQPSNQPNAELWMGIHQNGESYCANKLPLSQYLKQKQYQQLQFLYKVLSIEQCLSIQIHPNQDQARQLHKSNPQNYKDPNAKPELFVVLSQSFECFLGLVSHEVFIKLLSHPLFAKLLENGNKMTVSEAIITIVQLHQAQQQYLLSHYRQVVNSIFPQRKNLYDRLQIQFPNDIGLIVSLFLEYQSLSKYQSMYIDANVPHAYIRGECLQIMKNSDNVIRLGLTPKFKDIGNIQMALMSPGLQFQVKGLGDPNNKIYQGNQLNIQIIKDIEEHRMKISECRIGISIGGKFRICDIGANKTFDIVKGSVLLFEANKEYMISGEGELCIGWSTY